MLATHLIRSLRTTFPEVPFVLAEAPNPVATLTGPCVEMSPLQIFDDGDEATIWLGTITHDHFGCYEKGLSEEQMQQRIADDVVAFVQDLLADRIVGMSMLGGCVGGWKRLKIGAPLPARKFWKRQYVWSRALQ